MKNGHQEGDEHAQGRVALTDLRTTSMIWLNMDSTLDTLAPDAGWGAEGERIGREKDMVARKEGREDEEKKRGKMIEYLL